LSRKIREGYKFLSNAYDDGDDVFIVGFSRGAYTARSLVGMIRNCGLLPKTVLKEANQDDNDELMEAYEVSWNSNSSLLNSPNDSMGIPNAPTVSHTPRNEISIMRALCLSRKF